MSITLNMIVRDEEALLPACLRSVCDWVDELVIVDTGSVDATRDIAWQHGAKVAHFNWVDDFSAARNYALSFVRTPWTLWLDADDLVMNPEIIPGLAEEARKHRINAIWSTYLQDASCQQRRLQLFKTRDFTWQGVVHENPIPRNPALCLSDLSPLRVLHRKPVARTREAAEKYLTILLEKDPTNWLGIAESYRFLGQLAEAERYYWQAANHPQANTETRYVALFNCAKLCLDLTGQEQEVKRLLLGAKLAEAAHALIPHRAEALVVSGQIAEALQQPETAAAFYRAAMDLQKPDQEIGVIYHGYYDEIPRRLLSTMEARAA